VRSDLGGCGSAGQASGGGADRSVRAARGQPGVSGGWGRSEEKKANKYFLR
jgi:hypothetical protein